MLHNQRGTQEHPAAPYDKHRHPVISNNDTRGEQQHKLKTETEGKLERLKYAAAQGDDGEYQNVL